MRHRSGVGFLTHDPEAAFFGNKHKNRGLSLVMIHLFDNEKNCFSRPRAARRPPDGGHFSDGIDGVDKIDCVDGGQVPAQQPNSPTQGRPPLSPRPLLPQPKPWGRKGAKRGSKELLPHQDDSIVLCRVQSLPDAGARRLTLNSNPFLQGFLSAFISVHQRSDFFMSLYECPSAVQSCVTM